MKRILLIRFSSLGDVTLIYPLIKKLHSQNYQIDILTKKKYQELFQFHPGVHNIIVLENYHNLFTLIYFIFKQKYNKILDLHNNLRTFFIKLFFFYKTISYKKYRWRRFLLLRLKINLLRNNSVIRNYFQVLRKLNISYQHKDFNYTLPINDEIINSKIKKIINKKKSIIIAPFARHTTKEWVYFDKLIVILKKRFNIIIIGEKKDYTRAKKYQSTYNLCGQLNFNDILYLLSKSQLLITNDSGIMHLGAGTETPIIAFFGSTVKEFGFVPLRKNVSLLENKNLNCRPCHYHGLSICPKGHFKCMKEITLKEVLPYVQKYTHLN